MGKVKQSGNEVIVEGGEFHKSTHLQYSQHEHNNHDVTYNLSSSRRSYASSIFSSPQQQHKNKAQLYQNLLTQNDQDNPPQQANSIITIHRVILSKKKLHQLLTNQQISFHNNYINQLLQQKGTYHFFNYFHNQLFPIVKSYLGYQFTPRRMTLNSSIVQISHIQFCNLVELNLADQLLLNVEALAFINAQRLIRLSIKRNKIINMNGLVKCDFPNLQQLQIYLNPVSSMEKFYNRFHKINNKQTINSNNDDDDNNNSNRLRCIYYNKQQCKNLITQNKLASHIQYEGIRYQIMHHKIITIDRSNDSKKLFNNKIVW